MILKLGKTLSTVFTIDLLHILYIIHVTLFCVWCRFHLWTLHEFPLNDQ